MVAQSSSPYNLFFPNSSIFKTKLTEPPLPDAGLLGGAILQRMDLFLVHLLVEPVQHRADNRREGGAVNFARQTSDKIGQAVTRREIQHLLRHIDHAVHQRSAADQHNAREYLFVKAGPLDLFRRVTEDLLGARLKYLAQDL